MTLSSHQIRIMAAAAAAVLVVALGYFVWYKPSRPDMVLASSMMKSLQAESAAFQVDSIGADKQAAALSAKGSFSTKGAFGFSGSYSNTSGKLGFDVRSSDGQDIYAKFSGLDGLPGLLGSGASQYGISQQQNPFKSLENTWLTIPKTAKDTLLKDSRVGAAPTQLSDKDKRAIAEAYQKHAFLHVSKVAADEAIDGAASRHYEVTVDKARLKAFAAEIQTKVPSLASNAKQLQSVKDSELPTRPVDVWLAKDNGYITQIKYYESQSQSGYQLRLSKFNQPVNIAKPANAKPFFEALSSAVFSGLQAPIIQ